MGTRQKKICGIIGGVGPSATVDLYREIIAATPAQRDQEHLRVLIDSHPQIPDRTAAILHGGESPVPYIVESAKLLERAGADFLVIPCNTAHYFLPEVQKHVAIPFINMIEETGRKIKKDNIQRVGLLSTSGTARIGIYQKTLHAFGVEVVVPREEGITKEMEAIYGKEGIKAGVQYEKSRKNKELLLSVVEDLKLEGVEALIMGCTEIPLCLEGEDVGVPFINPTKILAQAAVEECLR